MPVPTTGGDPRRPTGIHRPTTLEAPPTIRPAVPPMLEAGPGPRP